jgi:sarcosine oxidase gamma subunit
VPDVVDVTVEMRRGDITSWGAGCPLSLSTAGQVSGRELNSRRLHVRAQYANLHFAAAPDLVVVAAPESLLAMPPGRYLVIAPENADIEVEQAEQPLSAPSRIEVSGGHTRILVSKPPLDLRAEQQEEQQPGG